MMSSFIPVNKRVLFASAISHTLVRPQKTQRRPTHLRGDIARSKGPSWQQRRATGEPCQILCSDKAATPPHPGAQASQAEDEQPSTHVSLPPVFSQLFVLLPQEESERGHYGEPRRLPIDRDLLPPPDRPWIRASRQRRETEEAVTMAISCRLGAN